jgi:hypothetical protein
MSAHSGNSPSRQQWRWECRRNNSRPCSSGAGQAARRSCAHRRPTMRCSQVMSSPTTISCSTTTLVALVSGRSPAMVATFLLQARADVLGAVCPHFAHIRKANPRDSATDLGKPQDSLLRMILRRGIPFGKPVFGVKRPTPGLLRQERGLMFLCYGSTIENQFEFLSRRWINSPIQPNFDGHDPILREIQVSRALPLFPSPLLAARIRVRRYHHDRVAKTAALCPRESFS